MKVLLLGLRGVVVEEARAHIDLADVEIFGGGSLDDMRAIFATTPVDHVILGGGLPLEIRLAIVREVFTLSSATTVHMKDIDSGPEGFFPFVSAVIRGLRERSGR